MAAIGLLLCHSLVRFVILFSIVAAALLLITFFIVQSTDPSCLGMTSKSIYSFQPLQKLKLQGATTIVVIETSNDRLLVIPKDEGSVDYAIKCLTKNSTVTIMLNRITERTRE